MDYVNLIDQSTRKARKIHKCAECRRSIRVGESYFHEYLAYEGKRYGYNTCAHCMQARDFYIHEIQGEFSYGDLYECLSDYSYEWPNKFYLDGMRRSWTKRDGTLWKIPTIY